MGPRILYVDDEADLVELAASFFEEENLPIETCTNFKDALELIRKNTYDLIISDVRMPSGSGHELFSQIKKEGIFHGKFILVTGNDEGNYSKGDYDRILLKPVNFDDLISDIKSMFSK